MSMASSGAGANPLLRIVDASMNRIGEGLRLLEDVARLMLNDSALTEQLKTLRHEMIRGDWSFHQHLLQARDAEGDVGIKTEVAGESKERPLPLTVMANARRVQESLRVLEELAKLSEGALPLPSDRYKEARFALYSIEQKLLSKLSRRDKVKMMCGVYAVIDTRCLEGRSHIELARQAIESGARAIELFDRQSGKRELLAIAQELRQLCHQSGILFIVRDQLDMVMASGADGLHAGQDNLPVEVMRKLLPLGSLLGVSVETVGQAVAAESAGADYLAVDVERLREIREAVSLPVVATGDISPGNIAEIVSSGGSVAVSGNREYVPGLLDRKVEIKNG